HRRPPRRRSSRAPTATSPGRIYGKLGFVSRSEAGRERSAAAAFFPHHERPDGSGWQRIGRRLDVHRVDRSPASAGVTRGRWMAVCFAVGSTCFLVGPFPGYAQLVGDSADAVTFFVGSILFTLGGALQSRLAWPDRHAPGGGRAAWWAAVVQSAGTLFFNVT